MIDKRPFNMAEFIALTKGKNMRNKMDEFVQKNYMKSSPFSSFLPGIAGKKGIPVWCYYVNRGQGVVSFGVKDKDHSIQEFYPAEKAYGEVSGHGFRTFIKENDEVFEAFSDADLDHEMHIGRNHMSVRCEISDLLIEVFYYVLPEEKIGALIRSVRIKNKGKKRKITLLDGLSAIIPYGISNDNLKNMTETSKAWMQSEYIEENAAIYKVSAAMDDVAEVKVNEGAVFAAGFDHKGKRIPMIVDPGRVFGYDKAYKKPVRFIEGDLSGKDNHSNVFPSAFFNTSIILEEDEEWVMNQIYGNTEDIALFKEFIQDSRDEDYFNNKEMRAKALIDEITSPCLCQTGNENFDAYSKNCYMDNGLRGGFPVRLGHNKVFYLYSRKHGDLERDYNFFSVLPEYYSQGNGNFRDVAQNRRVDTFFSPYVGKENIRTFLSLIQPDGYNPLLIEKQVFSIDPESAAVILSDVSDEEKKEILDFLKGSFTPGELYMFLEGKVKEGVKDLFIQLMDFSSGGTKGSFGEGYWCDHWTYILDLIEEYLTVYPDREKELLTEEKYTYYAPEVRVNPYRERYVETSKGIRQYNSLSKERIKNNLKEYCDINKKVVGDTLLAHLLTLVSVKFSTLDPYGFGIEMEGGKPGWYDALNGLPGLLGSSYGETLELLRYIRFIKKCLKNVDGIKIYKEVSVLIEELLDAIRKNKDEIYEKDEMISFWYDINHTREKYREAVYQGFEGKTEEIDKEKIEEVMAAFEAFISIRMPKALRKNGEDIAPMYFYYEIKKYRKADFIIPEEFVLRRMPGFLEGQVHLLKVLEDAGKKKDLYQAVKNSDIYDKELQMYKVNASLLDATSEIGRCKFFSPGWLENESIFLHMEYKYLLELDKAGLYKEFYKELKSCLVCFMDPEIYGRSILENSSFIASSANPAKELWGKGYVARLSGSTVEFLSMWRRMMFGENPFSIGKDGELELTFNPHMPEYLIPESKRVSARFLGNCMVTYHFKERRDHYPGNETVKRIVVYDKGTIKEYEGQLKGTVAKDIRDGKVEEVTVFIE